MAYDSYDRMTSHTDAMGNLRTITYDANGNIASEQLDGQLLDVPGSTGNVKLQRVTYTYDGANNRLTANMEHFDPATQMALGDGFATTIWTWSHNNDILTITDDNNQTSSYTYNSMNQLYSVFNARGNAYGMLYDNSGNVNQYLSYELSDLGTPAELYTTTYYYDGINRRVAEVDQANNVQWWGYNSQNMRTRYQDKNGVETRWAYDGINRMSSHAIDMNGNGADRIYGSQVELKALRHKCAGGRFSSVRSRAP